MHALKTNLFIFRVYILILSLISQLKRYSMLSVKLIFPEFTAVCFVWWKLKGPELMISLQDWR